jgi:pyruvate kinase
MSENPEPTRAEISDIATAVFFGADAVMLSDETASGKYPNESVRVMQKVINHVQASSGLQEIDTIQSINAHNKQGAISTAIIALANDLKATAIVAETRSGTTALKIASRRSNHPIIAITSSQRVAQQLAIVYSIKSFIKKDTHMQAQKITDWLRVHNVFKTGDIIISASGAYPGVVGATDTIKVRVIK